MEHVYDVFSTYTKRLKRPGNYNTSKEYCYKAIKELGQWDKCKGMDLFTNNKRLKFN